MVDIDASLLTTREFNTRIKELTASGEKEIRVIKRKLDQTQSDDFRRISFDNSIPTIVSIGVRFADDPKKSLERLADKIMNQLCPVTYKALYKILMPQISQRFN